MMNEAIKRAQAKYEKSGALVRKVLKLTVSNDSDIIEHLNRQSNVNRYLKRLIRDDIEKQG